MVSRYLKNQVATKWQNFFSMESIHKGGAYHCDKCGFVAARRDELWMHLEAFHRNGNYYCDK